MTITPDYTTPTRRAESVFTDALDAWRNGLYALTAPLQAFPTSQTFPQFDLSEAVERQFKLIQKVVDVNHGYAVELAAASNTATGAVRKHIEGLNAALLEQVHSVSDLAQDSLANFEGSVRETADHFERVQRDAREQVEQAER